MIILSEGKFEGNYTVKHGNKTINNFTFPVYTLEKDKIIKDCKPLLPFLLKATAIDQREEIVKIINKEVKEADRMLKYIAALIMNYLGYDQEEVLDMFKLKEKEFQGTLLQIPMLKATFENALNEKIREVEQAKEKEMKKLIEEENIKRLRQEELTNRLNDIKMSILDLLEIKYAEKAIKLYRKLDEINKLDVLKKISEIIRISKDAKEVEIFIDKSLGK